MSFFNKTKVKKLEVNEVSQMDVNVVRRAFKIPERISDSKIIKVLVNDLVNRYFTPEYWSQEDVEELLQFHATFEDENGELPEGFKTKKIANKNERSEVEECPNCHEAKLRYVCDTPNAINQQLTDDTNLMEVYQCPKCNYYRGIDEEPQE